MRLLVALVGVIDLAPRSCGGDVDDDDDIELAASAGVGLDRLIDTSGLLPPPPTAGGGACCHGLLLAFTDELLATLPPALARAPLDGAGCSNLGCGKTGCVGRLPVPLGPP